MKPVVEKTHHGLYWDSMCQTSWLTMIRRLVASPPSSNLFPFEGAVSCLGSYPSSHGCGWAYDPLDCTYPHQSSPWSAVLPRVRSSAREWESAHLMACWGKAYYICHMPCDATQQCFKQFKFRKRHTMSVETEGRRLWSDEKRLGSFAPRILPHPLHGSTHIVCHLGLAFHRARRDVDG